MAQQTVEHGAERGPHRPATCPSLPRGGCHHGETVIARILPRWSIIVSFSRGFLPSGSGRCKPQIKDSSAQTEGLERPAMMALVASTQSSIGKLRCHRSCQLQQCFPG